MFIKMRKGELKKLIAAALQKAGSERKLIKTTGIPSITIYYYKNEMYNISEERYSVLTHFIGTSDEAANAKIKCKLPTNWGRVKGGKNCLAIKKMNGTWEANFKKMMKGSSKNLKAWHKKMKKEHPVDYHLDQYRRFKKIGGYKYTTNRGEKVRNTLEKKVADLLYRNGLDYEYEPLVKGTKNYYFPDFKIGTLIIECTMWRGEEKAYKLLHKIQDLEKAGVEAIVIVPPELRRFYKALDTYLTTDFSELEKRIKLPR
ncbi:MAG: hypothetical protein NTX79_01695 [Candidatus Micrarchaeota archaeon]|nr:hypothetical protein [Candidatus Micrarchaeota archaeon]